MLHFLRQALGTQTTPSNQVLVGLALFLTILVMQPVAADMYHQGWEPLRRGQITTAQAMDAAPSRCKHFPRRFAREKDVSLFVEISHPPSSAPPHDLRNEQFSSGLHPVRVEGRLSDRRGAVLPFLVIDLVVASVTLSIGMMQLPPVMISAPFKILLLCWWTAGIW